MEMVGLLRLVGPLSVVLRMNSLLVLSRTVFAALGSLNGLYCARRVVDVWRRVHKYGAIAARLDIQLPYVEPVSPLLTDLDKGYQHSRRYCIMLKKRFVIMVSVLFSIRNRTADDVPSDSCHALLEYLLELAVANCLGNGLCIFKQFA
eukprot:IDg9146t1